MQFKNRVKNGESIAIIQFQYDFRCNFKCQHCSIKKFQAINPDQDNASRKIFEIIDVKELSRQADEMGLAHFVITGGEPLVFPDFDQLVAAIDPQKFYIVSDTNGWFLNAQRAKHLKSIGVDKIQLSLDSLDPDAHDNFRHKTGSHKKALRAIDASLEAGLNIILSTVVTKQRVRSTEFIEYLEFAKQKGVGVFVTYAKPVGSWEGNFEVLISRDDMNYMRSLEKKFDVFTHLTPSYGLDLGCIAVKRMVSVTKYGDIMPCPYIHTSLGNFFEEPLKAIIDRGMKIKFFGNYVDTCLVAEDRKFINDYVVKMYDKPLPVPSSELFGEDDFVHNKQIKANHT
jgi:MoaA/NifB/PqqE/SkfB family radical SAM enzyme